MIVEPLSIPGCYLFTPTFHEDARGGFFESFNLKEFQKASGIDTRFVQDNVSISRKGTLRGLHYQEGSYAQAKYLGILQGAVLDVVVDLRKDSPTYLKHLKVYLDSKEHKSLFIPKGMAHGFLALEEGTQFYYKCDNFYEPSAERGIHYKDPELDIDWGVRDDELILSAKDRALPFLKDLFL